MTNLNIIRQDLINGMTISDACRKYQISFHDLCNEMPRLRQPRERKSTHTGERHIQTRDGHYYLRKNINGKTRMFGAYRTLEDAIAIRNHCIEHGWKQLSIDKYCRELGITRCKSKVKGVNRRYH